MSFKEFLQEGDEIRLIGGKEYVKVKGVWTLKSSIKEDPTWKKRQREVLDHITMIENAVTKLITMVPIGSGNPDYEYYVKKLQTIKSQIHDMHMGIGGMYKEKK
jgi:hypothetical protein